MKDYIKRHLDKFHPIKEIQNFFITKRQNEKVTDFETILITRFNWGKNPRGIDETYLEQRFELFDKYTFPSINSQTDKDFVWILFLNSETPQRFKDMLSEYQNKATMKKMILAYVDCSEYQPSYGEVLKENYEVKKKWLLTCRCDNDDILAKNYIEEMKRNFRPVHNMYIDFIYGYNYDVFSNSLNVYKCRSCHFLGYVEDTAKRNFETVHNHEHSHVKMFGWVRRINNKCYPLWCEVIHWTNLVNIKNGKIANSKEIKYFENNFITNQREKML